MNTCADSFLEDFSPWSEALIGAQTDRREQYISARSVYITIENEKCFRFHLIHCYAKKKIQGLNFFFQHENPFRHKYLLGELTIARAIFRVYKSLCAPPRCNIFSTSLDNYTCNCNIFSRSMLTYGEQKGFDKETEQRQKQQQQLWYEADTFVFLSIGNILTKHGTHLQGQGVIVFFFKALRRH